MPFFLIQNSDGDTTVEVIDEAKLLKALERGDYGEAPPFLSTITNADTNYWPENARLLIRGEIVTPKAVAVATKYTLT